jgi:hypothetical protein
MILKKIDDKLHIRMHTTNIYEHLSHGMSGVVPTKSLQHEI